MAVKVAKITHGLTTSRVSKCGFAQPAQGTGVREMALSAIRQKKKGKYPPNFGYVGYNQSANLVNCCVGKKDYTAITHMRANQGKEKSDSGQWMWIIGGLKVGVHPDVLQKSDIKRRLKRKF
ncbi:MAG: hypothetical protein AAF564_24515 [Bacteroidota bacterium]